MKKGRVEKMKKIKRYFNYFMEVQEKSMKVRAESVQHLVQNMTQPNSFRSSSDISSFISLDLSYGNCFLHLTIAFCTPSLLCNTKTVLGRIY